MQRLFIFAIISLVSVSALAQSYPSRWTRYASDGYIYAIEEDINSSETSQMVFVNSLLDRARLNVAKQVNLSVKDEAQLVKESLNGVTNISYSSSSTFSTEAIMRLLRTDTDYDAVSGKGFAIAYLDKQEVCGYWSKEAERILQEQETDLYKAEQMIALGSKKKAKDGLEQLKTYIGDIDESLIWLGICSYPQESYQNLINRLFYNVRKIDNAILSLGEGPSLYVHSTYINKGEIDDAFAEDPQILVPAIIHALSEQQIQITEDAESADFILDIATYTLSRSKPINGKGILSYYANASGKLKNRLTEKEIITFTIERNPECYAAGLSPRQAGIRAFQSPYLLQTIIDKILNSINQ